MFCIHVLLTVREADDVDEIRELLAEAARQSRLEPGCLAFDVYHWQEDRRRFLLAERWESKEAWERHRQAEAFTTIYQPRVLPRVEREPQFCELVE